MPNVVDHIISGMALMCSGSKRQQTFLLMSLLSHDEGKNVALLLLTEANFRKTCSSYQQQLAVNNGMKQSGQQL